MLIKIMTLFLIAMAVLAVFAKHWFPVAKRRLGRRQGTRLATGVLRCPACGRPQIGAGPCPCGHAPRRLEGGKDGGSKTTGRNGRTP